MPGMRDKELFGAILGVRHPWHVTNVELDASTEEVRVLIEAIDGTRFACPRCARDCGRYDARRRSWRHLDTCQFKTVLVADVPRVECPEHGVLQIEVPWAEPNSGFTAHIEALIIDWLKEASILAVSRLMRLSWDQIDGVLQRAVRRGLSRRVLGNIARIGIDETSFQRAAATRLGHTYTRRRPRPERQSGRSFVNTTVSMDTALCGGDAAPPGQGGYRK